MVTVLHRTGGDDEMQGPRRMAETDASSWGLRLKKT